MSLVIRAQPLQHDALAQPLVTEFDERGGTIGRSDSNTMTLPDPERHVSRLQAEVYCKDGVFGLRNVGSSNPIIVNGRPLGTGEAVALRDRDRLAIGRWELRVDLQANDSAALAARPAVDARTVIGASADEARTGPPRLSAAAPSRDPFASLPATPARTGQADPFADLLAAPAPPPQAAPGVAPTPRAATGAAVAARLPDDFDPFAALTGALPPASRATPTAAAADTPLREMLGPGAAGPGIDTLFGLRGSPAPGQADALAAFLLDKEQGRPAPNNEPFSFLLRGAPSSQSVGPAAADHTPDLQAAYMPPPVRGPAAPPQAAAPAPAVAPNDPATHGLWDAFCDGAQLQLPSRQRLTPELMRLIGATLREAVEGTLQLVATRATLKQELRVAVTIIQPRSNNPLKFAPDAGAALAQLLQPPLRGFLAAPEAMRDAMTDLLGHSIGTIEGTRAALHGMLARFEPAHLEAQLAAGGMLDKLLPNHRRARLWELYLQHYGRIRESAREDFDDLFGKAFTKAYQAHADEIAAARRRRQANAAR